MNDVGLINSEIIEAYAKSMSTADSKETQAILKYTQKELPQASHMLSGPLVTRFLQIIVRLSQAQNVLDLGTFTGYSALSLAESLPSVGKVYTCDIDPNILTNAQAFFTKSTHATQIEIINEDGLAFLSTTKIIFDLIFIDADKARLIDYYEAALKKLKAGGILVIDDVLWRGEVLDPQSQRAQLIHALNQYITNDKRVINVLLPIRHGIQLVMRSSE